LFFFAQSLFAVFDGHGGDYTSRFLECHFASEFENKLKLSKCSKKTDVDTIKSSLMDTCITLNERLAQDPKMLPVEREVKKEATNESKVTYRDPRNQKKKSRMPGMDNSGACGVVVVVTSTHLVVAHVGDCRCLVQHRRAADATNETGGSDNGSVGVVTTLTNDHTCHRKDERERVETAGGWVDPDNHRIYLKKGGAVSNEPSRAWGDFMFKDHGIVCLPEISIVDREPNRAELLILGCDGIFEGKDRTENTVVSSLFNTNSSDASTCSDESSDTSIERTQLLVQQDGNDGNGGNGGSAPTTTPNVIRGGRTIALVTTEEICRDLREGCERVMLEGLDLGCSDNQTMCVALLCPVQTGQEGSAGTV
jgi:serine/threonine protein phosphatase PrpC